MGKIFELSDRELMTMKCIWDAEKPITCAEIIAKLNREYGLAYEETTVYTFIAKLKDKGFVDCFRKGVTYYIPLRDEESYRNEYMKFALGFWFGGSLPALVQNLLESKDISNEEVKEIRRIIDERFNN